jgi:hypothetical protein
MVFLIDRFVCLKETAMIASKVSIFLPLNMQVLLCYCQEITNELP